MNIALIKAGGVGQRMGAGIPKQFISIDGKPIIIYTLESFEKLGNEMGLSIRVQREDIFEAMHRI